MDIGFFREWAAAGEVHVGARLMKSVGKFAALMSCSSEQELIPDGYEDAGFDVVRYELANIRYALAAEVADLLARKCELIAHDRENAQALSDSEVLFSLLALILDVKNTHFEIG